MAKNPKTTEHFLTLKRQIWDFAVDIFLNPSVKYTFAMSVVPLMNFSSLPLYCDGGTNLKPRQMKAGPERLPVKITCGCTNS